jgi:hypothetical protein
METSKMQRGGCRFKATSASDGKPVLRMELFHPVPSLADMTVEFELLSGTTLDQARKLSDLVNERVLAVIVTKS